MTDSKPVAVTTQYHRAKPWQIILFTLNNTSTNLYLFGFGFVSYYTTGLVGLTAFFISQMLGAIRLFDGLIDPPIGVLIDRTETRFGKYRPIMLFGNLITALSFVILFNTHNAPTGARMVILIVALLVHKIGYSLQASCTKAGQTVLTSDPKQRPLFSISDGIFNLILFTGGQWLVSNVLTKRYDGFSEAFFRVFIPGVIVISFIMAVLAIIGIAGKDQKEYFGLGSEDGEAEKYSARDYFDVVRGNGPLVRLATAGGLIKLLGQMVGDQVAMVMLFGILLGDYGLSGNVGLIMTIPNLLIVIFISWLATRKGLRWSYVFCLRVATVFYAIELVMLSQVQPGQWSLGNISIGLIVFMIVWGIAKQFGGQPSTLVLTMTADVSDYEVAKSGRYVAGMMGTIFSLVDSIASSMGPVVIGWIVSAIGFANAYPTADTPLTPQLRFGTLLIVTIIPIALLILTQIVMAGYKLDAEAMEKIQSRISYLKENNIRADGSDPLTASLPGQPASSEEV